MPPVAMQYAFEISDNTAPFTLNSIQVGRGVKFRDEFEQACKDLGIKLTVLPPGKPKWDGCVERANGSSRYVFYPVCQGNQSSSGESCIIQLSVGLHSLSTP